MPPRLLSMVIVAFWLGMGAWLFVRDLWPSLRPGEPPPYTFMASDEAPRQGPPARWNLFKDGMHVYDIVDARTTYQEKAEDGGPDDTFQMVAILRAKQQLNQKAPQRRLRSFMRIGRDGRLIAVNAQLHLVVQEQLEVVVNVAGAVVERELLPRWRGRIWHADSESEERVFDRKPILAEPPKHQIDVPFPPLPFTDRGIVLNPLHPPNRLDALRPGQRWRMPLVGSLVALEAVARALDELPREPRLEQIFDLTTELVGPAFDRVPLLESQVLPQPQVLPPSPVTETDFLDPPSCWVIEARDPEGAVQGRLWVQQSEGERKGLVLRQEVVVQTERGEHAWIVQREH